MYPVVTVGFLRITSQIRIVTLISAHPCKISTISKRMRRRWFLVPLRRRSALPLDLGVSPTIKKPCMVIVQGRMQDFLKVRGGGAHFV